MNLVKKPVMLVILDGFGIRYESDFNGVLNSNMKNYFNFWNSFPHTKLHASGPLVGLPEGQIGSSEVGHLTIGAGRLLKQPIVRIDEEIENLKFFDNCVLKNSKNYVLKNNSNIHIMGLLGPGGVHSKDKHLYALLDFYDSFADKIFGQVFIHNFLDGRDTKQKSALVYLEKLENKINSLKNKDKFHIASICGRYFSMDRDRRFERTKIAYDMLVFSKAKKEKNYKIAIEKSYKNKVYDEFVKPVIFFHKNINLNDLCVFYNFRSDRPKQILNAFLDKNFNEFETKDLSSLKFLTMTNYLPDLNTQVLYPTIFPKNTLGEVLEKNKLKQLRIAETEKFPHVTYFFSGLRYKKFLGESQIKIDSPKVATYDLAPKMSAEFVLEKVLKEIKKNEHDFILLNFANSDMVGHTGDYKAVLEALSYIDFCLGKIYDLINQVNGTLLITADHGNCETMQDEDKNPHTKHTYNLVPFILCDKNFVLKKDIENLSLYNIAPTVLDLLNIKKPKVMNKDSLILK